jgi:hypothetical protein
VAYRLPRCPVVPLALAHMQEAFVIRLNRLFQIVVGSLVTGAIFACGDLATAPPTLEFATGPVTTPPTFTVCEFQPADARSRVIGPQGGKLMVGGHLLIVPPGALKTNTEITMATPAGQLRRVKFGPEGLTFEAANPAHLIMSYRDCTVPPRANQTVVYVNESRAIIEITPSQSDPASATVDSKLSHFSDYVLSTYAVVY